MQAGAQVTASREKKVLEVDVRLRTPATGQQLGVSKGSVLVGWNGQ